MVKRLYMETNGSFSLVRNEPAIAGLSVIPEWDADFLDTEKKASEQVCGNCGKIRVNEDEKCPVCGERQWSNGLL